MRQETKVSEENRSRLVQRLMSGAKGKEVALAAFLLLVISCVAGLVLYLFDRHAFLYFGDAASHLVRARQFFDSQRPGYHNIGTVWLPLPHLVLLPLVAIDPLFYSGIAGLLIGIPCLVCTGALILLIVRSVTGSTSVACISACLFGMNPNLVYMALTPMNELLFIFLVTLGGYALLRWRWAGKEYWLWACAGAVILASLCRYEAWLLVPFISLLAILRGIQLLRRSEHAAAVRFFTIAALCCGGVVFWFCWNYLEYGDPLKFARWTYTVAGGPARGDTRQPPLDALMTFGTALMVIFGPALLLTTLGGLLHVRSRSPEIRPGLVLLFFGLPALFALSAILGGFVQIDMWRWNWRYVLTASMFLAVAGGIGLAELGRRTRSTFLRRLMVVCLLAMPIVQCTFPSVGVATFDDARRSLSDDTRFAIGLGEQLRGIYRVGSIALLTGYGQAQRIMMSSGLPLKSFHIIYDAGEQDILDSLPQSEHYLVIGKVRKPESEPFVDYWLSRRSELLAYYSVRFENDHYLLMEHRPGSISPGLPR
jgi:hypothetical protein